MLPLDLEWKQHEGDPHEPHELAQEQFLELPWDTPASLAPKVIGIHEESPETESRR